MYRCPINRILRHPSLEIRIDVYWPLEHQNFSSTVQSVSPDGDHSVHYDDNNAETLDLSEEQWPFEPTTDAMECGFGTSLQSNEHEFLSDMLEVFGNQSFLRRSTQAFDHASLINAYHTRKRKRSFCCTSNVYHSLVYRTRQM